MATEIEGTLRKAIEAFNRRDFDAAARVLDAESEWDWSESIGPDRGVYRGPGEITGFWKSFADGFEDVTMKIEEIRQVDDRIVASMLSSMRGRGGIAVEARNAWLIEGGATLSRLTMFQSQGEALEAAARRQSYGA